MLEVAWLIALFDKHCKKTFTAYKRFAEDVEPSMVANQAKDVFGGFVFGRVEIVDSIVFNQRILC